MAVLRRTGSPVVVLLSFLLGAVLAAALTAIVVTPRPGDLVQVDERRGTIGTVSADGGAFVVEGVGSYRVFTTEGLRNLRRGERVVVGLVHVRGSTDVPLYIRPQG
jgi:hypothetical protein